MFLHEEEICDRQLGEKIFNETAKLQQTEQIFESDFRTEISAGEYNRLKFVNEITINRITDLITAFKVRMQCIVVHHCFCLTAFADFVRLFYVTVQRVNALMYRNQFNCGVFQFFNKFADFTVVTLDVAAVLV